MTLGGEIHDRVDLVVRKESRDQNRIGDVALHEDMTRVVLQIGQGVQIPGVGQEVEVDHRASVVSRMWWTKLPPMNPAPPVTRRVSTLNAP
jgi:hypothetical protein